jgi:hypothetical protein
MLKGLFSYNYFIWKRLEGERVSNAKLEREISELKKDIVLRNLGEITQLEVR